MKKLAIAGASVALLLTTAIPAFAGHHQGPQKPEGAVVVSNFGGATNNVLTVSNSGLNGVVAVGKHADVTGALITTGDALASAQAANYVNDSKVTACSRCGSANVKVSNFGQATNNVATVANSGLNLVLGLGGDVKFAGIHSGGATAGVVVVNEVNTTVVK
jgi:hypothetical protein